MFLGFVLLFVVEQSKVLLKKWNLTTKKNLTTKIYF
jgi:hypothetical protein